MPKLDEYLKKPVSELVADSPRVIPQEEMERHKIYSLLLMSMVAFNWNSVNQRAILTTVQRPILTSLLRLSAGFLALFEAEGIVAGFDDVAMVGDTVEQG